MKKKLLSLTVVTVSLVAVLALSATTWAAPAYGSAEWYLQYMQQYSNSPLTPSRPTTPTPTPNPKPNPTPNPTPNPNPTPTPRPNPSPSYPTNPQQNPNWYLDYLNRYQNNRPSTPYPTSPAPSPNPNPNPNPPDGGQPEEPPTDIPAGLTAEEQQLINYINQERAKAGVGPVTVDLELVRVARIRANKLVEIRSYEHNIPGLGTAGQHLTREGYKYSYLGENLAAAGSVYQAHANLIRSSGHRAIMLDPKFNKVGVGVSRYTGNMSGVMVIEIFAQR
ncbi:MAG: CAP domain-containing protein [bacterium]